MTSLRILVVDDEKNIRKTITLGLTAQGYEVRSAGNSAEACREVSAQFFDVVLLDLRLEEENGLDLIPKILSSSPWIKIIVITAHASIENAVEAMKKGASDYIQKPFSIAEIVHRLTKIAHVLNLEKELRLLKESSLKTNPRYYFSSENLEMAKVLSTLEIAARSEATILLTGESGTGKSVFARALHSWSNRADNPFSVISCPAMPSELLESELFGYVKGAFTGAVKDNPGRIAICDRGTLFLDEIADMPISTQAKLLHVIQEKTYQRLGDTVEKSADVRFIAATNVDLEQRVSDGTFREDLFHRLNVIAVRIPPLREHSEDIMPLAEEFLRHFSMVNHKAISSFTDEERELLMHYHWPGNIRELRNTIERSVILGSDSALNSKLFPQSASVNGTGHSAASQDWKCSLLELEKHHIKQVVEHTDTLMEAAEVLGIDQATLWRKRKSFDL
ncbi:MAG: sigma-54-dependent Fis family transcriptional regulator [Sphaerochaetaceae bacterium]|nr:sigma-54-dependent Fis family transcriptional regulator [Sphaerochaetaceae bacterium]